MNHKKVVIVGAGISGLTAAYYALRQGLEPTIIEESPRLGGLIQTEEVMGCRLEAGPDSFLAAKPAVHDLARELGIAGEIIGSNDAERRIFIVRNGQLVPMPHGMVMMVPTDEAAVRTSPLFSDDARRRFEQEESMLPVERPGDFSIAELVESHFGPEALEYVTEPLLAGVYGGDPGQLSARSVLPRFVEYEKVYGSLIKGARQEARNPKPGSLFQSFADGMEQLVTALWREIKGRVTLIHDAVQTLSGNRNGGFHLQGKTAAMDADSVLLAIPAYAAAKLLSSFDAELSQALAEIPYSSAVLGVFLFNREAVRQSLNGFGFLVPQPERKVIAAATWINTKFPSRIAEGLVAIRGYLVGREAEWWTDLPDDAIAAAIREDLSRLMGDLPEPVYSAIYRWPRSMPQYVVGHGERAKRIMSLAERHTGLKLISNYLDGVGIPDCVRQAAAGF